MICRINCHELSGVSVSIVLFLLQFFNFYFSLFGFSYAAKSFSDLNLIFQSEKYKKAARKIKCITYKLFIDYVFIYLFIPVKCAILFKDMHIFFNIKTSGKVKSVKVD